jgi:hypothetical protein
MFHLEVDGVPLTSLEANTSVLKKKSIRIFPFGNLERKNVEFKATEMCVRHIVKICGSASGSMV